MEDRFVPLFAFASNAEFFGVFPECKTFVQKNIRKGEIIELPDDRGFAVVLGVGLLEFERDGSFTPWHKVGNGGVENSAVSSSAFAQVYESSPLRGVPAWLAGLKSVSGLSVNCCTGTAAMAAERVQNFDVDVESMEGASCFSICSVFGMPCCEIRAVSNFATTRDKSTWRIKDALAALQSLVNSL